MILMGAVAVLAPPNSEGAKLMCMAVVSDLESATGLPA